MDFDSIANDLATDHGLKTATSKGDGSLDAIAKSLAEDHGIEPVVIKKGRLYVSPVAPPISGFNKETSDELNRRPEVKGGENPREGIVSVPAKAAEAALEDIKSGAAQGREGLGDIFSGKPATGIGKIGTGALSIVSAPSDAFKSAATDLTGSKNIGDRASLIAGGLPVAKAGSAASALLPRNKAISTLVDKITSNGRDYQALVDTVDAMKKDSRIGPADTSPAVQNMTQKLFTTEGDAAKNYLFNTSKDRVANLGSDVTHAYDTIGGVPVDVVRKVQDLATAAKKAGSDLINPAIKGAGPVNIKSVVDHIDNIVKPGVMQGITGESTLPFPKVKQALANVKSMISNKSEWLTSPQDLHNFQSALRTEAEARLSSGDGAERQLGHALMHVRNKLVNAINAASPKINGQGSYKPALSAYRDEKNIAEAFKHAHDDVFSKSLKMDNAPEVTKQWFDNLSQHEKEAAREGARLAVKSKMGVADNNSLAGTNFAKSEYNQEKLKILFGKEETEKLLRDLENTRSIKNTDQKIIEGSQTEMRRAGDEAIALSKDKPKAEGFGKYIYPGMAAAGEYYTGGSGLAALGTGALALGVKAGSAAKSKITDLLEKERNLHLAKMSLPVAGPKRDELIKELESFIPAPKQSLVSRIANKLPIAP